MSGKSLMQSFYDNEKKLANKPFLKQPFGDRWEETTWGEVGLAARKLATGLKSLGLRDKAHIGLVSKNCREWVIADLAIIMAGYVSVPFYATLTGDQLAEVCRLGDIDAMIIGKLEVWDNMKSGVPKDIPLIKFPHYPGNDKIDMGEDWDEFLGRFEPMKENPSPSEDDLWTIIFTSGTTGTPKGVMLTHGTLAALDVMTRTANPLKLSFDGDNRFFSFLPLNHIAERAVVEVACISYGGTMSFVESLATFAKNMADTRPTVFFAVPRIWTKLQQGILAKMPASRLNLLLKIPFINGVIKNKIKGGLGLDAARVALSGAAPIPDSTKDFFKKLDIPITEGYGMSENCAVCSFLPGEIHRPGSVGKPLAGVELRIDPDNDEVLMRADYVMKGYYKSPDKTAEVLKGGWLHTGDQGRIDEEGYLYLTGRVKDTFKTAKGKYVIPSPIEWKFSDNTDIEQMCLVGRGLPQPLLLVVLSEAAAGKDQAEVKAGLEETLKAANKKLESYKKVSTIVIVKDAFSVENGLLTPTLKIKRSVMDKVHATKYKGWHEAADAVVWEV